MIWYLTQDECWRIVIVHSTEGKPMKEVQEILREIVNDLAETAAGLVVVAANLEKLSGGKRRADALDEKYLAKQVNADFYKGILAKIDALSAVPPASA
jgi:hypothetical protein